MNFSYWEYSTWLSNVDFTIVGSGITGLNCALRLQQKFPAAKILILERGLLPHGASTKNAGFACFGSLSEILEDLKNHPREEVVELIKKRITGLELLRKNLGDEKIGYQSCGGYELFPAEEKEEYRNCLARMEEINGLLNPILGDNVFETTENRFRFKEVQEKLIYNRFEGQLNTGKMMAALLQKVQAAGVKILNNTVVEGFEESSTAVAVKTRHFSFRTGKLFIATNGFASQLGIKAVKPARAQVLITRPIPGLHIKGTFHLDKGYYYFRNVDNRILFGGGRNLDLKGEETTVMAETGLIQNRLEELLRSVILPETSFEIEHRWSGIMGMGLQKKPVIEQVSNNVYCGVRLAGMGIAIGSLVGYELADLI